MFRTCLARILRYDNNKFNSKLNIQKRFASSLLQSKAYINGKWLDGSDGATFEVLNPANGKVITCVPDMTVADCQNAIEAAKAAFNCNDWSSLTGKQRSGYLKRLYQLINEHGEEIAEIVTAESGKPLHESKAEVVYGNGFIEWFAEEARRIYGEIVPTPIQNREILVMKQPIGVAALITPWNFPLAMMTRKAGPALAAGCTIIIKPSEDTPLTCLAVAKLAEQAGFPKGVINVITSKQSAPIGELLCSSPDVPVISFTGSTKVGKILYRQCADKVKRIALELGGNAPFIVFDSANIEKAVDGAMISKFRNCGQTCVSSTRFFIQEGIYDNFLNALVARVKAIKIGPGECADSQIGPLINEMQFNRIEELVADAVQHNAKIIIGGKPLPELGKLFYAPTILTDVSPKSMLFTEEAFGPIISIIKFKTEEEALEQANNTPYGLAGYAYSENIQQIFRVVKRLEVGLLGINEGLISIPEVPFGGVKESGIGREGCHHGIDEYVEIKYTCLGNLKYH